MSRFHRFTPLVPFFLAAAAPLSAQSQLFNIDGGSHGGSFGGAVTALNDVNLDGFPDFAVGSPFDDTAGLNKGRVLVYSGANGSVLFTVNGTNPGDGFGYSIAGIPDANGDAKGEILVGAPYADPNGTSSGQVRLLSGSGGATILTLDGPTNSCRFGFAVAFGGTTGAFPPNLHRRLVIGSPFESAAGPGTGSVYLYDETGFLHHKWSGNKFNAHFGSSVSGGFDATGDAIPDVMAGSPDHDVPFVGGGLVSLMDGASYAFTYTFSGTAADMHLGAAVALLADCNFDGIAEMLMSAPDAQSGKGMVWLYRGGFGTNMFTLSGAAAGDHFGAAVANAGDANMDGLSDLLIGAPDANGGTGTMSLYSPVAPGTLLYQFTGIHTGGHFGAAVAGDFDVNGDHRSDVIAGAPDATIVGADQGNARVFGGLQHDTLFSVDGAVLGDELGRGLASLGDVNGDGYADFLVGSPDDDHFTIFLGNPVVEEDTGSIRCVSGANGATLWTIYGNDGDELGFALAKIGDVNGDGKADFVAGAPQGRTTTPQPGYVRIGSGANGATIATVPGSVGTDAEYATMVTTMPDVTGDGLPEVLVGAPGFQGDRGLVERLNSGTWVTGLVWTGVDPGERFGSAATAIADVNGDGKPDVLIGAPSNDAVASNAGRAYCRSGVASTTLFTSSGATANERFGASMCSLMLDNNPAFAIGSPGGDNVGVTDCGFVRTYFALNQLPYSTVYGLGNFDYLGTAIANIGDYNHDGFDDFAAGASEAFILGPGEGYVLVVSGYGGAQQYVFDGGAAADQFGVSITAGGDIDKDGTLDLLVGAPFADPAGSSSGSMQALSLRPQGVNYYGVSTPGCAGPQALRASSPAKVNNAWLIHGVSNTPPGGLGLLLVTDSPDVVGHDFFSIGIPLYVDFLAATQVYGLDIYGTSNGHGLAVTSIPNSPGLAGTHYYLQTLWAWASCPLPPFNLSASQAEELVILP